MKIKEIIPFTNSIYLIEDLGIDTHQFISSILKDKELGEFSYSRNHGHQTIDYTVIKSNYQDIFNKIIPIADTIIKSWGINCSASLVKYWTNIDYNMGFGNSHSHINCILSGVFYSKIPDGCGKIIFERPDPQEYYYKSESPNEYSYKSFEFNPIENCALLFPAYIKHRIEQHYIKNNEFRVSTSFDFSFK
jgi:uncharacterized protein (TIGR02466 family)